MEQHSEQKLIFIDLDGTLTPQSTWYELNMKLGITPEEDQMLFDRYLKNAIEYNDWTAELVRLNKERAQIQKTDLIAIGEHVALRSDAAALIPALKEKGYTTVLISGSVDTIVETVAKKLGFDYWLACTTAAYDDAGTFVNFASSGDESPAKVTLAKHFCQNSGFNLSHAYVVGDGGNEKDLFEICRGILLGSNEKLKPLAWKQVESLSEIPALLS